MVTRVESPPEQQQQQQQPLIALARSLQERMPESKPAVTKPDSKAPSESSSQQLEQQDPSPENATTAQQASEESSQTPSETRAAEPCQPQQTLQAEPGPPQQQEAVPSLPTSAEQQSSTISNKESTSSRQEPRKGLEADTLTDNETQSQQKQVEPAPLSEGLPENASHSLSLVEQRIDTDTDEQEPVTNTELPKESKTELLVSEESQEVTLEPVGSRQPNRESPQKDTQTVQPVEPEKDTGASLEQTLSQAAAADSLSCTPSQPVTGGYALVRPPVEQDRIPSAGTEHSPEESPAEDAECVSAETAALPNGLKPEFAFHLLEPETPKAACCVMEHSEFQ